MAWTKSRVNIAFACIVAVLAMIVVREIYINQGSPAHKPAAAQKSAGVQLPENHPSMEAVERLMALEQKIAQDPQNADYITQIANLYYDLGQFEKAADFYQQSLKIRPEDPGIETDLATCLRNLGKTDKALEILEKILQYRPDFPQAMFNAGIILAYDKNDMQGALRIWEDLLRVDPAFSQEAELEKRINQLRSSSR